MVTTTRASLSLRPETLDLDPPQQRRIAAALDDLADKHGSNHKVAALVGLGDGMISKLRLARRDAHHVQVPTIDKVAAACGVTRDELLSGKRAGDAKGRAA